MFSKYIDNKTNGNNDYVTMDEIIENMLNYTQWRTPELDAYNQEQLSYDVEKIFPRNQIIAIKGTDIEFNCIKYSYDTVMAGQENNPISAERLKNTNGMIIIYSDGVRTQYLVDRARGNNALRILRVLNNSEQNKIIQAQEFNISENFFIWLISKFMLEDNLIDEESDLRIHKIIGFKGERGEKQAVLSGTGNEVMNLFSSISFLIEMDIMTEIEVRLEKGNENFVIRFYDKNSQIDVITEKYVGEHSLLAIEEEKNSKVLLTSFIEIIPNLLNVYDDERTNDKWNDEAEKSFTEEIVSDVRNRLDRLLEEL